MSDRRRGADADDASHFSTASRPALRAAVEEVSWLLSRGYPREAAVRAAGDHHQLHARARLAVSRMSVDDAGCVSRAKTRRGLASLGGERVDVDLFNTLVSLEVLRGGAPSFVGRDGALRDLCGLRGSYRTVDDSAAAIDWLVRCLLEARAAAITLWIDAPVSNSGRVRALCEAACEGARAQGCGARVEMVRDADTALVGAGCVASADGLVIDRASSWVNLPAETWRRWAPEAWVIDLGVAS